MTRFAAALLLLGLCLPASADGDADSSVRAAAGISVIPKTDWSNAFMDRMSYHMDANALTTYDGTLTSKKYGVNLGVSATVDDNLIGKANRVAGWVGYDKFVLRIQNGKLSGRADWSGNSYGMPQSLDFTGHYTNVELLHWLADTPGVYIGAAYGSIAFPGQLNTKVHNSGVQLDGNPVYDPDFRVHAYSLAFGVDTMASELVRRDDSGGGLFAGFASRTGYGRALLSRQAIDAAQAANPGSTFSGDSVGVLLIDLDVSAGVKYSSTIGSAYLVLGLGYSLGWTIVPYTFSGADSAGQLGIDPSFELMRKGVLLRASLSW